MCVMCRYNMIPVMADILSESVKEKVTRIILATFRVSNCHVMLRNIVFDCLVHQCVRYSAFRAVHLFERCIY
jgi:hypothetical protein